MKQNVIFGLVWAGWAYEVSTGPDFIRLGSVEIMNFLYFLKRTSLPILSS